MHDDVRGVLLLDKHAQTTHRAERRQAIFARQETAYFAAAFGDTGEHQRAV